MVDEQQPNLPEQQEMTDDEALLRIAQAMKDNAPAADEKQNVHTFLVNVVTAKDSKKIANLRDDKEMNELGFPKYNVRGCLDLGLISDRIIQNDFFKDYFNDTAENTLATSLSRAGFLVKQATVQTKQIADVTRRRKVNRGMFGFRNKVEEQGGDTTGSAGSNI